MRRLHLEVAGWIVLAAAVAFAQAPVPPVKSDQERELRTVREEIGTLSAQLDDLAVRAYGIEGEIEKVALERRLQERRVAEAAVEQRLAEEQVAEAQARLAGFELRLDAERNRLERRLGGLYRIGRHGSARLFFAIDARAEPLPAVRLLRYLARRDAQSIERFEQLRGRVDDERRQLDQRRGEAQVWFKQQASLRDELVRLEQRQKALLAGTRREETRIAVRALELADRETKLAGLLDTLYGGGSAPLSGRPMQEFRGLLAWPARGSVSVGFGPRLDPRYGTRVPHNGVELATSPGAQVVAVYPGKVVYSASFEGYGPTVVVQHAGRVFSLYAGLASIAVERNVLVSLRQPLGSAGARLYFEIRVENRPEDPKRWIR